MSISGISAGLNLASGAMRTHSVGIQVAAHNVANVSTADFVPQKAVYATGPNGVGVELDAVLRSPMPLDGTVSEPAASEPDYDFSEFDLRHASGTELSREFPSMIISQRSFEANAQTVKTSDEMLGTLLNMIA